MEVEVEWHASREISIRDLRRTIIEMDLSPDVSKRDLRRELADMFEEFHDEFDIDPRRPQVVVHLDDDEVDQVREWLRITQ